VVDHLRQIPDVLEVEDLEKSGLIERQLMLVRVKAE
jgi:acetolactate synthase small subunit